MTDFYPVQVITLSRGRGLPPMIKAICAAAERGVSPWIAVLDGSHPTYKYNRRFVGLAAWKVGWSGDPTKAYALAPYTVLGALPCAIEVCFGEKNNFNKPNRRAYFMVQDVEPHLTILNQQQLTIFMNEKRGPLPTKPYRPDARANVRWDEEV